MCIAVSLLVFHLIHSCSFSLSLLPRSVRCVSFSLCTCTVKKVITLSWCIFYCRRVFFCQIIILAKILHNKISGRQQIHNNINYFSVFFFFSFHLLSKRNNVENFREAVFECHHQMKRKGIATSLNTHFVDFIRPRNWFKYVQSIILSSFFVKFDLQGMNECCG